LSGTAHRIGGLAEIAERYDAFLIDQFGVIHDGERLYAGVPDAVAKLAQAGKAVVVMTNSGKRSQPNLERLSAMGLALAPCQVLSSGEVAFRAIAAGTLGEPFARGRRSFLIGKRGDDYGFDHIEFASIPSDAEFLLIVGIDTPETSLADYRRMLSAAAERKIPALCCNPDLERLTSRGVESAPGAIAQIYEELGGKVTYVGKPHPAIYDHAIAAARCPPRSRVLAIGDSISHDVVGARDAGVAAALVLTGLSHDLDDDTIARQCQAAQARPKWIMTSLRW
jgi:HAD superfamily hydrolase (TIGR01459 family)